MGWDTEIDGPCFLTDVQLGGKAKSLCLQNKGWVTGPGNPAVDQLLECFPSVLKAVLPACLQLLPRGLISLGNLLFFQGVALCTGGPTAAACEEKTTSFLGLQFFSCEIEKVSFFSVALVR